jgi:XRE family aerobic/anaerobic benzoate catabolism transcriptional regulator
LRELAERSEVSERFLSDVERGRGNISLVRFAELAEALGYSPAALLALAEPPQCAPRSVVSLLGLRGAGKSTLGRKLAQALSVPFVELDGAVAEASGMSLSTLFEIHGEAHFRRLERDVLRRILDEAQPCVLATGGSIVTAPDTFAMLQSQTTTVWLRAEPGDHWARVVAQGDGRPMRGRTDAMNELREILRDREARYREAHHLLDTSAMSEAEALVALLRMLNREDAAKP